MQYLHWGFECTSFSLRHLPKKDGTIFRFVVAAFDTCTNFARICLPVVAWRIYCWVWNRKFVFSPAFSTAFDLIVSNSLSYISTRSLVGAIDFFNMRVTGGIPVTACSVSLSRFSILLMYWSHLWCLLGQKILKQSPMTRIIVSRGFDCGVYTEVSPILTPFSYQYCFHFGEVKVEARSVVEHSLSNIVHYSIRGDSCSRIISNRPVEAFATSDHLSMEPRYILVPSMGTGSTWDLYSPPSQDIRLNTRTNYKHRMGTVKIYLIYLHKKWILLLYY